MVKFEARRMRKLGSSHTPSTWEAGLLLPLLLLVSNQQPDDNSLTRLGSSHTCGHGTT